MNIVCRLMCQKELDTFMQGKTVVKGDKGDTSYEKFVRDKLAFTPIKYCGMISMGDITVMLKRMKIFYCANAIRSCKKSGSDVYMVVFEDNGETDFSPFVGEPHNESFNEPCKELLTYSYSKKDLRILKIYEIKERIPTKMFDLDKTPIKRYRVKKGNQIIQVGSYEEAINDMLHVVYSNKQIQQIYDGFRLLGRIEDIHEEYDEGNASYNLLCQYRKEFYGNGGIDNWTTDQLAKCKTKYLNRQRKKLTGRQIGEGTRQVVSSHPNEALTAIHTLTTGAEAYNTIQAVKN